MNILAPSLQLLVYGSEDIEILPNGLAFITSVSLTCLLLYHAARFVINNLPINFDIFSN